MGIISKTAGLDDRLGCVKTFKRIVMWTIIIVIALLILKYVV